MKQIVRNFLFVTFFLLVLGNIVLVVKSTQMGVDAVRIEQEIQDLKNENQKLVVEVSHMESLQYAASISASLGFTKTPKPMYFDNLKYARSN